MFSYQIVNRANIVSQEDSAKKWEFLQNDFLPQNDGFVFFFFFSEY